MADKTYRARPSDGVAWITGASSGIGRSLALILARAGWRVAVTARTESDLRALAAEAAGLNGAIHPYPGDVTEAAAMADLVAAIETAHGPIALAVLNAGIYEPIRGGELTVEAFTKTFAVNLGGTVACLVPVIDAMKRAGRGQIALVSSVAGYGGLPTSASYGASKAGLTNMAESLKFDLDRLGIAIQVVHPGFVDTPATADNPFPMPFLMEVDDAAARIARGLGKAGFEITFPRRFTFGLKLINLLPYALYFPIVNRVTGWDRRQD